MEEHKEDLSTVQKSRKNSCGDNKIKDEKSPAKRKLLPDAKYNSTMVTQFVNNMMFNGKKSTAFRVFYDAMDVVEQKIDEESALDIGRKLWKI